MNCIDCKYHITSTSHSACRITNRVNPMSCTLSSDEVVEQLDICFNCKHWLGGGDWGLSCRKNYYDCNSDGFREACEKFEREV
jgi:hypothetical protein